MCESVGVQLRPAVDVIVHGATIKTVRNFLPAQWEQACGCTRGVKLLPLPRDTGVKFSDEPAASP